LLSRYLSRLRDENGIALVMALGILVVLSLSVTTATYYSARSASTAKVSDKQSTAYMLAEAGINSAMALLSNPTTNAMDKYALCPDSQTNPTLPCWHNSTATCPSFATGGTCYQDTSTTVFDTGTVTWEGTYSQDVATGAAYWTLKSTGQVRNPSPTTTAQTLTRTLTATITVIPTVSQPLNNPSWNYVFDRAPNWSGIAYSGCDMTLTNSVNVTSNLYVLGNLCFQNTSQMTKGILYVKGSVQQQATNNTIGTSTTPLTEAHVGMGCQYKANASHNPCQQGAGSAGYDQIWATTLNNTLQTVTPPTVDWNGWYLNASPGPYYPCTNTSNLPPFSWDTPVAAMADSDANKLTYKNDNQGLVNLTPGSSYTCQTLSGEFSWNNTTKTFTIKGTMYLDGSAYISNGSTNLYTGSGVLYLSGTFLIKNSNLCPASATTSCDSTKWNNGQDLLGIVANGNASSAADAQSGLNSNDSIGLVSSHLMGAAYATNNIDIGTTSILDGPMDAATIILGQSSNSTFNGFTYVPVGLPGENTVYAQPQKPAFSGG
jgi:Tfp pilus assembly protein PilX